MQIKRLASMDRVQFLSVGFRTRMSPRSASSPFEIQAIEFGGPTAISPLEVVARFEEIGGRPFNLEHVPETTLRAQFEQATDLIQKGFAALLLRLSHGDAINMASIVDQFGIKLTSVDEYARRVLGKLAG